VNCAYCGTALPEGALFCGECGRSVPRSPSSGSHTAPVPAGQSIAVVCRQCGATLAANDIFCSECGLVSHTVSEVFITPGDTARIEPMPVAAPMPVAEPVPAPVVTESAADAVPVDDVVPVDDTGSFGDDLESTRIVSRHQTGERFILQFSTGESVTVYGSGLIGRNPRAEPGEHFDQMIRIVDATRSVSKTHVEFGQESGAFWIKDRFSGNGTVVREPEERPLRALPDHRHRVVRGSRVDMGEQFFVVS
jgi:predicted nucleic acid-binding Zn ribbon protein